jgi:hypothetical protein
MSAHAFIFPGQGSQSVGMGRDLAAAFAAARQVFEEVDEVLKQKLSKLMFEGPGEELTLTENTQPALMAISLAVLRVLETCAKKPCWSPGIRWANTARWPPPAASASRTRQGCCACAASRCSERCPPAPARWRP